VYNGVNECVVQARTDKTIDVLEEEEKQEEILRCQLDGHGDVSDDRRTGTDIQ